MAKMLYDGSARRKTRKPKTPSRASVAISCVNCALLALVLCASLPLALPRAFGYQPYTVVTGSMAPEIPVGSLVYIENRSPEGIAVDEVAAFYKNGDPGDIIIHRVMANDKASGQLTTKGDANPEADADPVRYSECIGTVAKSFPKLGTVADALTSKAGKAAVFCLVGLAAVMQVAGSLIDRRGRRGNA